MPKNDYRTLHWVLPLLNDAEPYKQYMPNPTNYQGIDELVISHSLLKKFVASGSQHKAKFTFSKIREEHQRCVKNTKVKRMGEPFGYGAFAQGTGLLKGDSLIYSGLYSQDTSNLPGVPRYLASLAYGLSVNAQNINGIARYAQHLPDNEYDDLIAAIDEKPAMENVYLMTTYVSITINKIDYIIPVSRLEIICFISPGTMIGYAYGKSYWKSQEVTPSIFTPEGEPLKTIVLSACSKESDGITFYLNKSKEQLFINQRYIRYNFNTLFILPKIINELSEGNANGVFVHALYRITCKITPGAFNALNYFNSSTGDEMIAIPITKKPDLGFLVHTDELMSFLQSLNCRAEIKDMHDMNLICLFIKDIAEMEIVEAEKLFNRLNNESDTFTHMEFTTLISPSMRNTIEKGSGFRWNFFANKTAANNVAPEQFQAFKI